MFNYYGEIIKETNEKKNKNKKRWDISSNK